MWTALQSHRGRAVLFIQAIIKPHPPSHQTNRLSPETVTNLFLTR